MALKQIGTSSVGIQKIIDGVSQYIFIRYSENEDGVPMTENPVEETRYMGVFTSTTNSPSDQPSDYDWTLVKGEDGRNGADGIPGKDGIDGTTTYTWLKYADTPTSGMSNSPDGKAYIGIAYNKTTPTESTNYADYKWSLVKGEDGIDGEPGEDGKPTYTWVQYADDESGAGMAQLPDGKKYIGLAFNKNTPTESNNPADYSWALFRGSDGRDGKDGIPGVDGEDGKTYYTWLKYADTPTSGMSDSPTGKTYMGLAYNKESATESTNYADYTWSLIKGTDGVDGKPGADGKPKYTWVKYADDSSGKNMVDLPDGKLYIGLAYNKDTATESTNPSDYQWALFKGVDGVSLESVEEFYQVSTSNTTAPTSWEKTPPSTSTTNKYLWNYEVMTFSDGSKKETKKRVIGTHGATGQNGIDGNGIASIENYYLTNNVETGVTTSTAGWSLTPTQVSSSNRFMWNYEKITYTNGKIVDTKPTIIGVYGKDGVSSYTWIRYSANENGNPMTTVANDDTKYIGVAITTSSSAPTDYTKYTWARIKGSGGLRVQLKTPNGNSIGNEPIEVELESNYDGDIINTENIIWSIARDNESWKTIGDNFGGSHNILPEDRAEKMAISMYRPVSGSTSGLLSTLTNGWQRFNLRTSGVNSSTEILGHQTNILTLEPGFYTQSLEFRTDSTVNLSSQTSTFTWYSVSTGHQKVSAKIELVGPQHYRMYSTFEIKGSNLDLRPMDFYLPDVSYQTNGTYLEFNYFKVEKGSFASSWSPFNEGVNIFHGRDNKLNNGDFSLGLKNWNNYLNTTGKVLENETFNGSNILEITATGSGGGSTGYINQRFSGLKKYSPYSVTLWAKGKMGGEKLHAEVNGSQGTLKEVVLTTEWKEYKFSLTSKENAIFYLWLVSSAGTVYVTRVKLEEGSNPTSFTPSLGESNGIYLYENKILISPNALLGESSIGVKARTTYKEMTSSDEINLVNENYDATKPLIIRQPVEPLNPYPGLLWMDTSTGSGDPFDKTNPSKVYRWAKMQSDSAEIKFYKHYAYAWNKDGTERFATSYPNENLVSNVDLVSGWEATWNATGIKREETDNGIKITATTSSQSGIGEPVNNIKDGTYTVTLEARGTGVIQPYFLVETGNNIAFGDKTPTSSTEFNKMSFTVNVALGERVVKDMSFLTRDSKWIEIKSNSIKLEEGATATVFTKSMNDDPFEGMPTFIGEYTDKNENDSNKPEDYKWSKTTKSSGSLDENGPKGIPLANSWGWIELSYEELLKYPWLINEDGSTIIDWIYDIQQQLEQDAIVEKVMGSSDLSDVYSSYKDINEINNVTDSLSKELDEANKLLEDYANTVNSLNVQMSEFEQTMNNFNFGLEQSGGINLLRNSTGFQYDSGDFAHWEYTKDSTGKATQVLGDETVNFISLNSAFMLSSGTSNIYLSQKVKLPFTKTKYSLSFYAKHNVTKDGAIAIVKVLIDGAEVARFGPNTSSVPEYIKYSAVISVDEINEIDIQLVNNASGGVSDFSIGGIMLNIGPFPLMWQPYNDEVYSSDVKIDSGGIKVSNSGSNSYTVMNPNEFSGYYDGERVFTLNKDVTEVKKLTAEENFKMHPIQIITVDTNDLKGWAYVGLLE